MALGCFVVWGASACGQESEAAVAPAESTSPVASAAPAEPVVPVVPVVPQAPLPIDQQPYRVLVAVGVAADPQLDAAARTRLIDGLRSRIATRLGPLWVADVELADWLGPGRVSVLQQFTEAALNARYLASEFDKVFLATVEADGAALRISAREWDKNSQTATAVTSNLLYEPRVAADLLLAEVLSHFRPIAAIELVAEDGVTAELRLRGGELLPPDGTIAPIAPGAYLRPYFRYLDRKKELRQLQAVPWTYLQVGEVQRGRMTAQVSSAFGGVLGGTRRRTELMAIAVKPRFTETQLRIYPRGQRDNPQSGVRVDVLNRRPTADDAVPDRLTLYTSRVGEVTIPVDGEHPLQYVYVMSGKSVLAMVPFIPGDAPRAELEVPDDSARLAVEGEVAILEAELIEIVARREVTAARLLGHARAKQWEQADLLTAELKNLPTKAALKDRLERIRLPAVAAAKAQKNRVAEARINQMCQQVRDYIDQHLDPDRVTAVLTEVRELKEAG